MVKQGNSTAVPRLRFPEFQREMAWKTWQLGDVCELYQPETVPSSSFTAEGAHLVYGAGGIIGRLDRFNHEDAEVIIGCRGVCGNASLTKPRSWITGNAMVVRPKADKLSKPFLFHSLDAADLSPVISGSAQPQITRQGLRRFSISTPAAAEQQKIADCLTSLDEAIAAQGRIVAALKTHKRGLMQQLFPREGETRPRLRFPEFRNAPEWEEASIGNRSRSFSGGTPSTTDSSYYGGGIPFIRSAEIGSATTELYLTEQGLRNSAAKLVAQGDVLVALYGANSGDVALAKISGAINQAILCIRPEGSKAYLYHFLTAKKAWIVATFIQGGQGNLSGEIVKSVTLQYPSVEEQQRIADCLSSLDDQIAAQSHQLAALKTHKQGLMQQLFPAPGQAA